MHNHKKGLTLLQKSLIVFALVLLIIVVIFISYFMYSAANPLPASQTDNSAMSKEQITITENKHWFSIKPIQQSAIGIIIYPGAFADPKAYVKAYKEMAKNGVSVFIIRSPFNFALINTSQASDVMKDNPQIGKWFVAGHSLGGVAACEFTKQNQQMVSGLILLASYCNGNASSLNVPVLIIAGSKDGLSTLVEIQSAQAKLPSGSKLVVIEGANHTQFGSFSKLQPGDNQAIIPDDQAQQAILDSIKLFINQIASDKSD